MLRQIEGSRAVAETVARCRPEVVCAYPISPQTHIIEAIGEMVKAGTLSPCEFINVESEFAAMSVSIGASAAGARAYTATASQGLLFMMEAVYNAAGLGLPDRDDARQPRDRRADQHLERPQRRDGGPRLRLDPALRGDEPGGRRPARSGVSARRELSLPVMVCMDGFILTHAVEGVDLPEQPDVDAFLPAYEPRQVLDPDDPISIGAMVGPEAFAEVRYLSHLRQLDALELIPALASRVRRGLRARERWPGPHVPDRGRRDRRRRARVGPRHNQRCRRSAPERRRSCRRARHHDLPPLPPRRGAPGAVRRPQGHRRREGLQRRLRRRALDRRRHGDARCGRSRFELWSPVSAVGRSPSFARSDACRRRKRSSRAGHVSRPRPRDRQARAHPDRRDAAFGALGREPSSRPRRRRVPDRLRRGHDHPTRPLLPSRELRRRQPTPRRRRVTRSSRTRVARTRSTPATAPARDAVKRSAPDTPSTRRCGRRAAGSSP